VQAQVGMHPDETLADGVIRAEALCDLGYPNWRDRPAIDRGNDAFVCGDSVAAADDTLRAIRGVIHI
jgi:hypothetical protein